MIMVANATVTAVDFARKSTRAVLVALALGAVFALGAHGLVEADVPAVWIWLWGIAAFLAFAGGLSFWAVNASKRWADTVTPARRTASSRKRPAPPAMVSADTMTYWYAAALGLLLNMLATAFLIATVDMLQAIGPHMPIGVVCNLAGYLVIIGALRQK